MSIPYRTRRNLRRILVTVLVLTIFLTLALLCWLLWLNRYVIYYRDGARLDFDLPVQYGPGETPVEPESRPPFVLHDPMEDSDDPDGPAVLPLQQLNGFYVTLTDLTENFESVQQQLAALPDGSTVMLELKDAGSYVYYTSDVASEKRDFDTDLVDLLIQDLQERNFYVIARIPAFQERDYILEDERGRFDYGLEHSSGGSLWWDSANKCYWLDPTSDGTMTYLIQLVTELRSKGFDEVVFSDFRFPDTDSIRFEGDRQAALVEAASTLVKTCSTDSFCISFTREAPDLELPEGRTRLYLTGVVAADADTAAEAAGMEDPAAQVVFLTDMSDTRYEVFSVLRPLEDAH